MPDVWFIRHGECTANVGGATRTAREACLTVRGCQQAQCVADYLRTQVSRQPIRIIASSYLRAQQTAEFTHHFFKTAPFEVWQAIQEFDYLFLPTDVYTTTADRLPLVNDFWRRCDPSFRDKNKAESFNSLILRVQETLKQLRTYDEKELILVFSHHHFIQAVRWLLEHKVTEMSVQKSEMLDFHQSLAEKHLSNGAILKTQLGGEDRVFLPYQTSHLIDDLQPAGTVR